MKWGVVGWGSGYVACCLGPSGGEGWSYQEEVAEKRGLGYRRREGQKLVSFLMKQQIMSNMICVKNFKHIQ
jgi:hypothetical protein